MIYLYWKINKKLLKNIILETHLKWSNFDLEQGINISNQDINIIFEKLAFLKNTFWLDIEYEIDWKTWNLDWFIIRLKDNDKLLVLENIYLLLGKNE